MAEETDTRLEDIGKLTLISAHVEARAAWLTDLVLEPGGESPSGKGPTYRRKFSQLRRDLLKHLRSGNLDPRLSRHASELAEWIEAAKTFMDWRNEFVHAVWMFSLDPEQPSTLLSRDGTVQEVRLERVRRYVARGEELTTQAGDLWNQMLFELGHLDGLIEATKKMAPDLFEDLDGD